MIFLPYRRRRSALATAAVSACFCLPSGCSAQTSQASRGAEQIVDMPAIPPDSVPADIMLNADSARTMARDIVAISFKAGTTVEEKRQAITAVRGTLVGGIRSHLFDGGYYLVRIPDPGKRYIEALLRAEAQLELYDYVLHVTFYNIIGPA